MSTLNADWLARNALRAHPLDDAATAVDDAGIPLPPDILVDCSIRFPAELGMTLFLAGAASSPGGVSLAFQASNRRLVPSLLEPNPPEQGFRPVAAISLAGRVPIGRPIPVEPAVPGVSGWVILGPGAGSRTHAGRLSTLEQGAILPGRARPRTAPGVRSLATAGGLLDGLVGLAGDADVLVESADLEIDGAVVRVAFIGLRPDSTLAKYVGPCGARPESGSCDPPPLEWINEVGPDLDGDLRIRFEGIDDHPMVGRSGGVVLDVPSTLEDVCPPRDRLGLDPDTGAPERPEGRDAADFVDFRETGLDDMRLGSGMFSLGSGGATSRDPENLNAALRDRRRIPRRIVATLIPPEIGGTAGIALDCREGPDGLTFLWAAVRAWGDGSVRLELLGRSPEGTTEFGSVVLWTPSTPGPPTAGATLVELAVSLGEPREDGETRIAVEVSGGAYVGNLAAVAPTPTSAAHGVAAQGAPAVFQTLEALDDVA